MTEHDYGSCSLISFKTFEGVFKVPVSNNYFSKIFYTSAPLWQLLKYPLNMHSRRSEI